MYARIIAGSNSEPVGATEAAADSTKSVAVNNASFMGTLDIYEMAQIRLL